MSTVANWIINTQRSDQKFLDIFGIPLELILSIVGFVTLLLAILSLLAVRKSNELKTVPQLIIEYKKSGSPSERISLTNIGKNIATSVKIMPLYLMNQKDGGIYKIFFEMKGQNYIEGKKNKKLSVKSLKNGAVHDDVSFEDIIPNINLPKQNITVTFQDLQGISYFTLIKFSEGFENIYRVPTKLNIYWKIRLYLVHAVLHLKIRKRLKNIHFREFPKQFF